MLGDAARVRRLGGVKVKGKTVETEVFELVGLEDGRPRDELKMQNSK